MRGWVASSLNDQFLCGDLAQAESNYDFEAALSADGRQVHAYSNMVFELKYPNLDIMGSVR